MADTTTTDKPEQTPEPETVEGFNAVQFNAKINAKIKTICTRDNAWATKQGTELVMFIFEEYIGTLEDIGEYDADAVIKDTIHRFMNMGNVYNRLRTKNLITAEAGKTKVDVSGLL